MKKITFLLLLASFLMSNVSKGQSIANYTIEFNSIWESVTDNPTDGQSTIPLPDPNSHWSDLVGATHKTANTFLELGKLATPGIESVAETGGTSTFQNEVTTNPDADKFINGGGLGSAKGLITISSIDISADYPLVTLASMIAPSPDWFIAVNSVNLRSGNNAINNGWESSIIIDLFTYDAGTEDGNTYSTNNPASSPLGVITSLVNVSPFNNKKIGTLTFTYNSSTLSNNVAHIIENIKIYPNPTKGNITISNIQNIKLKNIEIYSVLGDLVALIPVQTNIGNLEISTSGLSNGIYLLKLNTDTKISKIQKLIVH
jgi:hypothetical protein